MPVDAPVCQPKPRDCTSSLDNDCNGKPDNQETTYCDCLVGEKRRCQEHPGLDGFGICTYGNQTCAVSTDKTTSAWGACSGSVGPGTEVCAGDNKDENCNNQVNEGCACTNGVAVPCDCGGTAPCNNGQIGACSKSKTTFYRDVDGDGAGNPASTITACAAPSGYVANPNDCNDQNGSIGSGYATCDNNDRKYCDANGAFQIEICNDGCLNGECPSYSQMLWIEG
jgi:hypothetical protein